jgi:hypothetical protein
MIYAEGIQTPEEHPNIFCNVRGEPMAELEPCLGGRILCATVAGDLTHRRWSQFDTDTMS